MEQARENCKICSKNLSKYKCPKCLVNYCSVSCYKNEMHSQCSEKFYRTCFMDGLNESGIDKDSKRNFFGMLSRLRTQLEDVSIDETEFVDTLGNEMDTKSKQLWDMLDSQEKKVFCEKYESGDFSSLVELWEPWWTPKMLPLLNDVTENNVSKESALYQNVDHLNTGNFRKLSDKICFSVVNIIYGYVYVSRLFNGGCTDLLLDMAKGLQNISAALGESVFPDVSHAVAHCIMSFQKGQPAEEYFVSEEFCLAAIQDVVHIVSGSNCQSRSISHIKNCLSNCRDILKKAVRLLQKERLDDSSKLASCEVEGLCKMFSKSKKKLEFLIDWSNMFGGSVTILSPLLEEEFHARMSLLCEIKNDEKVIKEALSRNRTCLTSQPKIFEL